MAGNRYNYKNVTFFTHPGVFHTDDLLTWILFELAGAKRKNLHRQVVPAEFPEGDEVIVFDTGRGAYDHHQRNQNKDGVCSCALSLVLDDLGPDLLNVICGCTEKEATMALEEISGFVQDIASTDNFGPRECPNTLVSLINSYRMMLPDSSSDESFFKVVDKIKPLFRSFIQTSVEAARSTILIMEHLHPNKRGLVSLVQPDPANPGSFVNSPRVFLDWYLSKDILGFIKYDKARGTFIVVARDRHFVEKDDKQVFLHQNHFMAAYRRLDDAEEATVVSIKRSERLF